MASSQTSTGFDWTRNAAQRRTRKRLLWHRKLRTRLCPDRGKRRRSPWFTKWNKTFRCTDWKMNLVIPVSKIARCVCWVLLAGSFAMAADKEHGTILQDAPLYVSPDLRAQRVANPTRGLDTFVIARSMIDGKPWAQVMVTITEGLVYPKNVTG